MIHSVVSHDRSIASSKPTSPQRRSSVSVLNFQYLLISLSSSSCCLRLLPRLLVPSNFPSITCFRKQFLCKMWPTQSPSPLIYCMWEILLLLDSVIFLRLHTVGPTDLLHPSPISNFETLEVFPIYFPKCPSFSWAPRAALKVFSVNLNPFCWWKESTCWMVLLPWQFCIQFHVYILHHLLSYYPNNWHISYAPVLFCYLP